MIGLSYRLFLGRGDFLVEEIPAALEQVVSGAVAPSLPKESFLSPCVSACCAHDAAARPSAEHTLTELNALHRVVEQQPPTRARAA